MLVNSVLLCAFNVDAAEEIQQRWDAKKIVKPSSLQQEVIEGVIWEDYNIIVGAVAGSGKTSLLMAVLDYLKDFNDDFVEPTIFNIHKISTRGQLIHTAMAKYNGNNPTRYRTILGKREKDNLFFEFYDDLKSSSGIEIPNYWELRNLVLRLIDLVRLDLVDLYQPDEIVNLALKHGLNLGDQPLLIAKFVSQVLIKGTKDLIKGTDKRPDLTDLIYLPVYKSLNGNLSHDFKFDLIIVDECQDLSRCQLELIKLCAHKDTRYLFVGDPRQAIYGFAGADCDSFEKIKTNLNCHYYPLSVNYRCPKSVLDLARKYCPEIEPCEKAPIGSVEEVKSKDIPSLVSPGDMVLSRLTAPLITYAIQSIKLKKAATVKGRDIGSSLCDLIKSIAEIKGFSYSDFINFSDQYFGAKLEKLKDVQDSESKTTILQDQKEAIESCYQEFIEATNVKELCDSINSIFDNEGATILFQTIHKAKGSEKNRVFIVDYDKVPLRHPKMTSDQSKQEDNLIYVALTRCKFELGNNDSGKLFLAYSK